ncbi:MULTISPECIES: YchJ family protein [unclassified Caballeronia]|uniref:YchJ family protein n=1 Tax=unclassified Caballeronia TaxID=2646786 RepID=UPI0028593CA4|nr:MULTISPECIES: YchJ family protein [unclassified Caballeronia]MDR5736930.1 YchJ family protein [Caballeronia sp. LZ016]MDR5810538.1 YchJ family protein [Caballeronia sp. LZ019]
MKPVECPCGGASPAAGPNARAPRYADCCGRFIDGHAAPANAMELMRSRYTAYVLGNTAYLRATWDDSTCPPGLDASDTATRWLGLQIKRHTPIDADHEEVEFVARYKVDGRAHRLHEASRFRRAENGRWIYIDGEIKEK